MTCDVRLLADSELGRATPGIIEVYRATFTVPPWDETEEDVQWFSERLSEHARRARFRCAVAGEDDDGRVVGFAYGYDVEPGEWWYDVAWRALGRASVLRWLSDSFELVELAVMPYARGNGIGGRLHDTLLARLSCQTAVLTTLDGDTPAKLFYRRRGWDTLVTGFIYPGSDRFCILMGLDLKLHFQRGGR